MVIVNKRVVKHVTIWMVLLDIVIGIQLYIHGWPKKLHLTPIDSTSAYVSVADSPLSFTEWLVLGAFIGLHLLVIFLIIRQWRLSRRIA